MGEITWGEAYFPGDGGFTYDMLVDDKLHGYVNEREMVYRTAGGAAAVHPCPEGATIDELKALCVALYRMQAVP